MRHGSVIGRRTLAAFFILGSLVFSGNSMARGDETNRYVGSQVCGECHDLEYETFTKHSKKARSYESVEVMKAGLTEAEYRTCLECHATGYGKPGGFTSVEETPHLKNAGCEACHGPGRWHVETGDGADIRRSLSVEDCQHCHNEERVASFGFKPAGIRCHEEGKTWTSAALNVACTTFPTANSMSSKDLRVTVAVRGMPMSRVT